MRRSSEAAEAEVSASVETPAQQVQSCVQTSLQLQVAMTTENDGWRRETVGMSLGDLASRGPH